MGMLLGFAGVGQMIYAFLYLILFWIVQDTQSDYKSIWGEFVHLIPQQNNQIWQPNGGARKKSIEVYRVWLSSG